MSSEKMGPNPSLGHAADQHEPDGSPSEGWDFSLPRQSVSQVVAHPAPVIDGYEMDSVLSDSGAQGVVWRARQKGTERDVAIKLFDPMHGRSAVGLARFEREVRLAARLEHPHIAGVYHSGLVDGCPWYSMELVDGRPLDQYAEDRSLTLVERIELMIHVCRAIQHAHERGIIHRDLKPSNVLVTEQGQPRVLDFGLARSLDTGQQEMLVSQEGQPLGNLLHMAPEQARGDADAISTRTDVYGLGIMLYRLVTGREPRDLGDSYYEALREVAEQDITPPRQGCPALSREFEAILLKAAESEPGRRYATAGQLADDLENYLAGDPIQARGQTFVYVLRKKLWKHRYVSAAAFGGLLLLCAGVVFYIHSIQVERRRTEQARQRAVAAARTASQNAMRASTQRALALRVLDRVVFDIQAQLSDEMGQTRLRDQLLATAVAGLREIAQRSGDYDAPADRSAAAAAMQIGDTLVAVGKARDAVSAYREAMDQFTSLLAESPDDPRLLHDVCIVRTRLASALLRTGRPEAAEEMIAPAATIAHRLETVSKNRSTAWQNRWALEIVRGDVQTAMANTRTAVGHYRKAVDAAESRGELSARDGAQRDLSLSLKRLGDGLMAADQPDRAETAYRRALAIDERLVKQNSRSFRARRDLAAALTKVAECLHTRGRHSDAAPRIARATDLYEALKADDAQRAAGRVDLAAALYISGRIALAQGERDRARSAWKRAAGLLKELADAGKLDQQPDWQALRESVLDELSELGPSAEGGRS